MADAAYVESAVEAAPKDYTIAASQELLVKAVRAVLDGTNAGGPYLPAVQLLAPSGAVMWAAVPPQPVAAGASADVSWFPGGGVEEASAASVAGNVGGDLAGSLPNPSVVAVEAAGPTRLVLGTIPDGDVLQRSGSTIVGTPGVAGVSSLDGITGAVTLVAGTNITLTDNVPAPGEITIAAAGGGGSAGLVKLFEQTLVANAASIDTGAGGIPAGHGDLVVFITARTNRAAVLDSTLLLVNNDTAADYDNELLTASGSGLTAVATNAINSLTNTNIGTVPGNNATAGIVGMLHVVIPAYDKTTFNKAAFITNANPLDTSGAQADIFAAQWRSTAAVSRLSVAPGIGTLLLAGSRMVVYGTQ